MPLSPRATKHAEAAERSLRHWARPGVVYAVEALAGYNKGLVLELELLEWFTPYLDAQEWHRPDPELRRYLAALPSETTPYVVEVRPRRTRHKVSA